MGVIMNYQKFMELVPKETKDFVFTVLKNYSKYGWNRPQLDGMNIFQTPLMS